MSILAITIQVRVAAYRITCVFCSSLYLSVVPTLPYLTLPYLTLRSLPLSQICASGSSKAAVDATSFDLTKPQQDGILPQNLDLPRAEPARWLLCSVKTR